MNHKKLRRLYREERLQVRRRGGRKRALGTRAPMALPQRPNQRWCLDFVSDAFTDGRRFRILAIVDDFTREMPGAGRRHLAAGPAGGARARCDHCLARPAADVRLRQRHRADQHGDPAVVAGRAASNGTTSRPASRSRTPSSRASTAGCATSASTRRCSPRSPRPAASSPPGGTITTGRDRIRRSPTSTPEEFRAQHIAVAAAAGNGQKFNPGLSL